MPIQAFLWMARSTNRRAGHWPGLGLSLSKSNQRGFRADSLIIVVFYPGYLSAALPSAGKKTQLLLAIHLWVHNTDKPCTDMKKHNSPGEVGIALTHADFSALLYSKSHQKIPWSSIKQGASDSFWPQNQKCNVWNPARCRFLVWAGDRQKGRKKQKDRPPGLMGLALDDMWLYFCSYRGIILSNFWGLRLPCSM